MSRIKLTDEQKKKILADYVINQNYSETARLNNVTDTTVRTLVKKDSETLKKVEEKKEENTKDILEYMDTITDKQKKIIDLSLEALEKKLENPDMFTNVKDIATVYGVIFDKAIKSKEMKLRQAELQKTRNDIEDLTTLAEMLGFNKENNNANN